MRRVSGRLEADGLYVVNSESSMVVVLTCRSHVLYVLKICLCYLC